MIPLRTQEITFHIFLISLVFHLRFIPISLTFHSVKTLKPVLRSGIERPEKHRKAYETAYRDGVDGVTVPFEFEDERKAQAFYRAARAQGKKKRAWLKAKISGRIVYLWRSDS